MRLVNAVTEKRVFHVRSRSSAWELTSMATAPQRPSRMRASIRWRSGDSGVVCSDFAFVAYLMPTVPMTPGAQAGDAGDMLHEIRRGRLAVGPRDADELKALGGIVVEVCSRVGHRLAAIGHDHLGDVGRIGEVDFALDDEDLLAPRSMASWAKEWPSVEKPTMQKNISPGVTRSLRYASPSTISSGFPRMVHSSPSNNSAHVLLMIQVLTRHDFVLIYSIRHYIVKYRGH